MTQNQANWQSIEAVLIRQPVVGKGTACQIIDTGISQSNQLPGGRKAHPASLAINDYSGSLVGRELPAVLSDFTVINKCIRARNMGLLRYVDVQQKKILVFQHIFEFGRPEELIFPRQNR